MGASRFFAVSLGGHLLLGAALGAVPPRSRHEVIAISFVETKKPSAPAHLDPPPKSTPPPPPEVHALRAKTAPAKAEKAPPVEASALASSSLDALPDFGLALSGGGVGGVAVPGGYPRGLSPAPGAAKTLSRSTASKPGDCSEATPKPRLVSQGAPPAYTDDARAAGVSGKVRVEITVDDRGRVVRVRVIQGLGHGLDESALASARAMTFDPAVRCGRPASATFNVSFKFAPP
jgi:periplasmic protein TonB